MPIFSGLAVCPECRSEDLRAEVELTASPERWDLQPDGAGGGSLAAYLDLADCLVGRVECDECGHTLASDLDVQVIT
jgi:hypothetical protein